MGGADPTFQLLAALVARTYDTVRYEQVASAQLNASRTDPLVCDPEPASGRRRPGSTGRSIRWCRHSWFDRRAGPRGPGPAHLVSTDAGPGIRGCCRGGAQYRAGPGCGLAGRFARRHPPAVGRRSHPRRAGDRADDDQLQLDDRLVVTPNGAVVVDSPWAGRSTWPGSGWTPGWVRCRCGCTTTPRSPGPSSMLGAPRAPGPIPAGRRRRLAGGRLPQRRPGCSGDLAGAGGGRVGRGDRYLRGRWAHPRDRRGPGTDRPQPRIGGRTLGRPVDSLLSPEPTVRFSVPSAATPPMVQRRRRSKRVPSAMSGPDVADGVAGPGVPNAGARRCALSTGTLATGSDVVKLSSNELSAAPAVAAVAAAAAAKRREPIATRIRSPGRCARRSASTRSGGRPGVPGRRLGGPDRRSGGGHQLGG